MSFEKEWLSRKSLFFEATPNTKNKKKHRKSSQNQNFKFFRCWKCSEVARVLRALPNSFWAPRNNQKKSLVDMKSYEQVFKLWRPWATTQSPKLDFPEIRPTLTSCNFFLREPIFFSRHGFESTKSNSFISEVFMAIWYRWMRLQTPNASSLERIFQFWLPPSHYYRETARKLKVLFIPTKESRCLPITFLAVSQKPSPRLFERF